MATASFGFGPLSVSGYDPVMSFVEGSVNGYFDKKSEKRAYKRQLRLMDAQYQYAQRYAENSPSWNVLGLRNAGLNPILAVSNGANLGATIPSAPSVTSHKPTPSSSEGGSRYDPLIKRQITLLDEQIKGQQIKNKNDSMNRGLTGQYGAYSRLLSEAQEGLSGRPQDHDKVMDAVSNAINNLGSFLKNGPSVDKSKSSVSDSYRSDGSSFDTPPEMSKWQKHVNTDGFDSRLWSRSSKKHDGQYRYEKRQHWKSVFTR